MAEYEFEDIESEVETLRSRVNSMRRDLHRY